MIYPLGNENCQFQALTTLIYISIIARKMSSIRIDLPPDKAAIILKRIQNKLSGYKGYKIGTDARISSQILSDDIKKRVDVSLTNFKAAIDNLEMYDKHDEKDKAGEVYRKIEELKNMKVALPSEPLMITEPDAQKLYLLDEAGFRNSIDLLDNINSFRSASISGDFDAVVLEIINGNIENISKFVDEKNISLKPKN
ncbi:MAG: hypothetical protein M1518_01465 [Candidatus Thermoplasmatota archaeon]|jgi:hypothetical protein|nr:hypothetical protein [Candidatus Thermoplasmatota archaeon]